MTQLDNNNKTAFYKSIKRLMSPIVRLALRRGISVNDLHYWLKALYVEEAEHFTLKGRKQSASRIAILTGLDRKEVARLRELNEDGEKLLKEQTKKTNRALRAINAWKQDEDYLENGEPKTIPLYGDSKGSFAWLISNHCGDVSMVSVLSELKQANLIQLEEESISLKNKNYIPRGNDNEQLALMGQATGDLLKTIEHNIEHPTDISRLQLSVAYSKMPADLVNKLKTLIDKDGLALLNKLDTWLNTELELQKDLPKRNTKRAGVGIYYFEESEEADKTDESD